MYDLFGIKTAVRPNPKKDALKVDEKEPRLNMLREENLNKAKECKPLVWTFEQENMFRKVYDTVGPIEDDHKYLKYWLACQEKKKVVRSNPKPNKV